MFIGFYNFTVVLTYIGLGSAVFGMMQAMARDYRSAVLCLLICGLCDMFDGKIARWADSKEKTMRTEDEKSFGIQIDTLCDVICFGVFPAVLGFSLCPANTYSALCMIFFVLAAVIRLAYFNVLELKRDKSEHLESYRGLPVTSSALIMPCVALITALNRVTWANLYPTALAVLGLLFIGNFKVKKPYRIGIVALAVVGLLVFFLTIRYGGSITCLKDGVGAVINNV